MLRFAQLTVNESHLRRRVRAAREELNKVAKLGWTDKAAAEIAAAKAEAIGGVSNPGGNSQGGNSQSGNDSGDGPTNEPTNEP